MRSTYIPHHKWLKLQEKQSTLMESEKISECRVWGGFPHCALQTSLIEVAPTEQQHGVIEFQHFLDVLYRWVNVIVCQKKLLWIEENFSLWDFILRPLQHKTDMVSRRRECHEKQEFFYIILRSWTTRNYVLARKTYPSEMPSTGYVDLKHVFFLMMLGRLNSWEQHTSSS